MKCLGIDDSPVDTVEVMAANGRLRDGSDLIFGGATRIADQSAVGQGNCVEKIFTHREEDMTMLRTEYARAHGAEAAAAQLPAPGTVSMAKLAHAVIITDNATPATAGGREVMKRITASIDAELGADAVAAMSKVRGAANLCAHTHKSPPQRRADTARRARRTNQTPAKSAVRKRARQKEPEYAALHAIFTGSIDFDGAQTFALLPLSLPSSRASRDRRSTMQRRSRTAPTVCGISPTLG